MSSINFHIREHYEGPVWECVTDIGDSFVIPAKQGTKLDTSVERCQILESINAAMPPGARGRTIKARLRFSYCVKFAEHDAWKRFPGRLEADEFVKRIRGFLNCGGEEHADAGD